jgi:hypothetical protein
MNEKDRANSPFKIGMISGLSGIGYQLSQSDEAIKQAIYSAFSVVRQMRKAGTDMRIWSDSATVETRRLIDRFNHEVLIPIKERKSADLEKLICEFASWENKILETLRTYIHQTTELGAEIKKLNPPLTSSQLKPFSEAMQADRQLTLTKLESLTKNIEQLTALKTRLRSDSNGIFFYRPAV